MTPSQPPAPGISGGKKNRPTIYYALKYGDLYVAETNECRPSYVLMGHAILAAAGFTAPSPEVVGLIAEHLGVNAEDLRIVRFSVAVTEAPFAPPAPAEGPEKEGA